MTREWQQTRNKDIVMPDAVYYQTLWAVRDLRRMEGRLAILRQEIESGPVRAAGVVSEGKGNYAEKRPTEDMVIEKTMLEARVKAIHDALQGIPIVYRGYILDNIILHRQHSSFPNKIWKMWKQRFLFDVAKNLSLI
ncbi:MAG: hypothetical protein IIY88_01840 [Eubacterium sp.]|nr:hypothetical protein [Eubacterium sp.]